MAENEAPELKPCPWCKAVPEVLSGAGYNFTVECLNETCPVSPATVGIRGRANAIKAWNTRADLAAPDAAQVECICLAKGNQGAHEFVHHTSDCPVYQFGKKIQTFMLNNGSHDHDRGLLDHPVTLWCSTCVIQFIAQHTANPDAVRQARRETWRVAIKTLENLPIVINRQGVRKGSDLNGWASAIHEGVKAFRATLRAEGKGE